VAPNVQRGQPGQKPRWQSSRFSRLKLLKGECLLSRLAWVEIGCRVGAIVRTTRCNSGKLESAVLGFQQFESLVQGLVALILLRGIVIDVVVLGLADEDGGSNGLILNLLTVGSLVLCDRE
jgi:hypothetical protein